MRGRSFWRHLLALLTLSGCTASQVARQGRHVVIGMDAAALQACAGIFWSYENKYERTGGVEVTLPIIGGIAAGGSDS